jgi:NitT/TauT family transport system substrate-binding protein
MKTRSLLILLSTLLIVILSLSGCGGDKNTEAGDQNKTLSGPVDVVALQGAGEEATASLPDGYTVDVAQKTSELETLIQSGSFDLAVVPANMAARLYAQTGGDLVAISPVDLGGWYIISNKGYITSQEISDLRGKTILAYGQGGTGDAMLRALLSGSYINPDYGVRMEWVDTPAQVLEALKEPYTVALLQEPFAAQAMSMADLELTSDIDLGMLWGDKYGFPAPSDVLIANKRFIMERGGDVEVVVADFQNALTAAKESAKSDLVFYGSSTRGMDLLKEYMAAMEKYDISLIGGESLDAAFYHGIGE